MQQSASSFVTEPLAGNMQPPPFVNSDQLFRDSSLPEQGIAVAPAASQFQTQPPWGGTSLLSLLGQGQGQGFGPTDPPRESPWISLSDPTREPPAQQQFPQINPDTVPFRQQEQFGMTSFGQQQPSMMSFSSGQAQDNNMLSLNSQQMNFQQGQPQMDLNMMQGNPNMMGGQQMNFQQGQPQMDLNMMQGNPNMMGGQQMNFQQ